MWTLPHYLYYDPDHFHPSKREEFFKWYDEQVEKKMVFNVTETFFLILNTVKGILVVTHSIISQLQEKILKGFSAIF